MVYLDYSATTKVNSEVLDAFVNVSNDFLGNSNSLHKLGVESKELINQATDQIANILNIKSSEIIYTSGATESNNLAIKGICLKYKNRGNHIITTNYEHSSIYGPIGYLQKNGFEVSFVNTDESGLIDKEHLKSLLTDKTILVTIASVNSETGLKQNVNEIGELLRDYKCFFHVDMTQSLGKDFVDLNYIDLVSFASHKIYGLNGIGLLYKKESIIIEPLINGGKSTSVFRSGTPNTALIASFSKAIRLVTNDLSENIKYVKKVNNELKLFFHNYKNVFINSNEYCIPHILNISIKGIKPETFLHALEKYDIYISTKSACSNSEISKAVLELTKNNELAKSAVRISLSHLTSDLEINYFKKYFDLCYKELMFNENR